MTHAFAIEKMIRTDSHKDWAAECATTAMALVLTARLALENEGSGICSDNERACVVADTLEVAYSLMAITSDGVEEMQREGRYGTWREGENESAMTAARS
ncbi:hypothetical protein [Paracoccus marcusii]|uniref:hypothetical protein n=1 Tax=Paracoccus marcusii TaxID=59779 RepID=UPI001112710F|nr:hypothetical protein [Paracoccus marcusii]TNB96490.1 hypothetical protein FHD68_12550 [Paracoccus marcusii]